jgi:hypothetical protein
VKSPLNTGLNNEGEGCKTGHVKERALGVGEVNEEGKEG